MKIMFYIKYKIFKTINVNKADFYFLARSLYFFNMQNKKTNQ